MWLARIDAGTQQGRDTVAGGGGWYIEPGERVILLSAKGGERLLFKDYSFGGGTSSYWLARFDAPPEHSEIVLREIRPATAGMELREVSPDGRFALFVNYDGLLEIIDLPSIEKGAPVSYTMNFVDDKKLIAAQPFIGRERRVYTWTQEVPEETDARHSAMEIPLGAQTPTVVDFNAENAPVPAQVSPAEPTSGRELLKCRDSSGAMVYTQGYCPPGTTQVKGTARE
jgi:hypothetical protein